MYFIAADTRGLFGSADMAVHPPRCCANFFAFRSVFNDFGPKFTCVDPRGEQPLTGMIVSVDKVFPAVLPMSHVLRCLGRTKKALLPVLTRHDMSTLR